MSLNYFLKTKNSTKGGCPVLPWHHLPHSSGQALQFPTPTLLTSAWWWTKPEKRPCHLTGWEPNAAPPAKGVPELCLPQGSQASGRLLVRHLPPVFSSIRQFLCKSYLTGMLYIQVVEEERDNVRDKVSLESLTYPSLSHPAPRGSCKSDSPTGPQTYHIQRRRWKRDPHNTCTNKWDAPRSVGTHRL